MDPEIIEMMQFLDPEIVEKVDKSYIKDLLVWCNIFTPAWAGNYKSTKENMLEQVLWARQAEVPIKLDRKTFFSFWS